MKSYALVSIIASFALLSYRADAKCSHGLAKRGKAEHLARRKQWEAQTANGQINKRQASTTQGPTNLAQQEQITNPVQECVAYNYAPEQSLYAQYPGDWEIASIMPGDTAAQNAYQAIISNPAFPNLTVKGTPEGDFSTLQYNNSDPDCWWTYSNCVTSKRPGIPADVSSCPEPNTWGLTYDDGPNCTHNAFYDFLQSNNQTATLFYIGSNVMDWPLQAQRGLAEGHEIGVHTWSHHYSTALTNEQFFAELWYTRKMIKTIIGITPTIWRPPYGDVDDRIRFIATAMNLTTVIWDNDTLDWEVIDSTNPTGLPTASVLANYNSMFSMAQGGQFSTHGTIVLTHEIDSSTMGIAQQEYPTIKSNFKNIVPVGVCQNWTRPYIEANYLMPTFSQWTTGQISSNSSSLYSSDAPSRPTITTKAGGLGNAAAAASTSNHISNSASGPQIPIVSALAALVVSLILSYL